MATVIALIMVWRLCTPGGPGRRATADHERAPDWVDHADGRDVTVAVVDDTGRPVQGASVRLFALTSPSSPASYESTGEDGRARVSWPDGAEYGVAVEKPEHEGVRRASRARDLMVTLTRHGRITGFAYELESGNALPDVIVRVLRLGPAGGLEVRPAVRPDARWEAVALMPGRYSVAVSERGHLGNEITDVLVRPGEATEVDVPLTAGLFVRGRVVDLETGQPITSGTIGDSDCRSNEGAALDHDGRFVIQGRTDSIEWFRVWALGWSNSFVIAHPKPAFDFQGVQTTEAVVSVPRAGVVSGVVVDSDDIPVSGATVVLGPNAIVRYVERVDRGEPGSNRTVWATTDIRGEFALPRWHDWSTAGELLVRSRGYAPMLLAAPALGEGPIVVRLQRGADLVLNVRDQQGHPAGSASCELLLRDPQDEVIMGDIRGQDSALSTGRDGRLLAGNLCAGLWVARVMSRDREAGGEADIRIEDEGRAELTIDLRPVDRVFGRVLDDAGHAFGNATVMLRPHLQITETDDGGRFLFSPVTEQQTELAIWCPELRDRVTRTVMHNTENVITLERRAAFTRQVLLLCDDSSMEPIRWGSVRVTVDSAWARDIPFVCGRIEVPVPRDGGASVRCRALGYEDTTAQLRAVDPRGVRLLMRKSVSEKSPTGVTLSLKICLAEPPIWIGLYDAATMQRLPPARRVSDEEYVFVWPHSLRVIVQGG